MKSPIGKKQLLLAVLVIALGAAVYLNYFFSGAQVTPTGGNAAETSNAGDRHLGDSVFVSGKTSTPPESADYFQTARQNREAARDEAVELIKDVFNSAKSSADERNPPHGFE